MTTWRPAGVPRSERDPVLMADYLERLTRRLGTAPARVMAGVFAHWEDLVGPDIAAHARPVSLRDGLLIVAVEEPAWAAQLRYMQADLLARLAERLGPGQVDSIRLRVEGERPPRRGRETT